jgi:hypothetical protein
LYYLLIGGGFDCFFLYENVKKRRQAGSNMVDDEFALNFYSQSCLPNAARVAKGAGLGLLSSPISSGRKKENRKNSVVQVSITNMSCTVTRCNGA